MTEATQMEVKANKGFKKRLFKSFKVRYFSVQPKERSAVQVCCQQCESMHRCRQATSLQILSRLRAGPMHLSLQEVC